MPLGEKIYVLRTSKSIKQEQVAIDLEISQSTYCDWENNISTPRRENLVKLAEYFKVNIKDLEEEIYRIDNKNIKSVDAIIMNDSNSKNDSTDAIVKIAESLEKLTVLLEKFLEDKK